MKAKHLKSDPTLPIRRGPKSSLNQRGVAATALAAASVGEDGRGSPTYPGGWAVRRPSWRQTDPQSFRAVSLSVGAAPTIAAKAAPPAFRVPPLGVPCGSRRAKGDVITGLRLCLSMKVLPPRAGGKHVKQVFKYMFIFKSRAV